VALTVLGTARFFFDLKRAELGATYSLPSGIEIKKFMEFIFCPAADWLSDK
jgi:hypothetical protein